MVKTDDAYFAHLIHSFSPEDGKEYLQVFLELRGGGANPRLWSRIHVMIYPGFRLMSYPTQHYASHQKCA